MERDDWLTSRAVSRNRVCCRYEADLVAVQIQALGWVEYIKCQIQRALSGPRFKIPKEVSYRLHLITRRRE